MVLIGQRRNIKAFGKPYRKKKMFLIEMSEIYADKFSNLVVRNVYDNNMLLQFFVRNWKIREECFI